jgi:hypothetical protein
MVVSNKQTFRLSDICGIFIEIIFYPGELSCCDSYLPSQLYTY